MKRIYLRILFYGLFLVSMSVFAAVVEPVITHNVHVIKNVQPGHCPTSWDGDIQADSAVNDSGAGQQNLLTSPGVRSCTHCRVDTTSGDCVCKTCYDNYDA